MNFDVTSADIGLLPGQIDAQYSADLPALDGTDLCDFDALVQRLSAAITDITPPDTAVITDVVIDDVADDVIEVVTNDVIDEVVVSATVGVSQPDDAPVSETRERLSDQQSSLTAYYADTGPDVLPLPVVAPVTVNQAPPDTNVFAGKLPVNLYDPDQYTGSGVLPPPVPVTVNQAPADFNVLVRELPVPAAPDRGAVQTTVPETTSSAESADGRLLGRPVGLPTGQPELSILSSGTEPPTIPLMTASEVSGTEVRPAPSHSPASLKATPPPLPEMLIAGGQYHARAVAHLPNLGTVQVEMTRASASEVAVHVHAAEALTVAALERSSATLHHLVASTIQPATMATEAAITEASYGSEPGIKIAMSLTSQNQSHANSRAFQPQGPSSRPEVVPVTLPERLAPVTSLVDLLV